MRRCPWCISTIWTGSGPCARAWALAFTPDTLLYGTGGLAFGEVEHSGTIYGSALGIDVNGNPITVRGR